MRLKDRNPQILHMETLLAGNKGSLISRREACSGRNSGPRQAHAQRIIHVPAVYLNFLSEMLMPRKQIQGKSV